MQTDNSSHGFDKLEAVRDLLFGQNVQEYQTEFKEIRDLIQSNREEVEKSSTDFKFEILNKIDQMNESINRKIDATASDLSGKIEEITDSKADRKKIASLLQDMAQQLES